MSYTDNNKFKTIFLGDDEYFKFPNTNSKITRKFCNDNEGKIPVYASSKNENEKLGNIKNNLEGVHYYENCISWNRNGSVGYVFVRNHRFATNEDHRALLIKNKYKNSLSKKYLKYAIERKLLTSGFSYLNKCGVDKIKSVSIEIPISDKGIFDIELQKEMANQHEQVLEFIEKIQEIQQEIKNQRVNLEEEYTYVEKSLDSIFESDRGSGYYTKKRILGNNLIGDIPIYSSKTKEEGLFVKIKRQYLESEDDLYYQNCLTWTTDGYAGTIFIRNQSNIKNEKRKKFFFVITDHCGILIPKVSGLYMPFMKRILQPKFYDRAKGYGKKELKLNQVKNIMIKIPIDLEGNFDYEKQREIVKMYEVIDKAKQAWSEYIQTMKNHNVDIIPN